MPAAEVSEITIRDVATAAELHAVEQLQREVWGIPDLDVVPLSHLVATKTAGGVLIGAFDEHALIGFVYGFPAIEDGEMTHHSHMLAVKADHRGHHLGERLKFAQRERVLAQGIEVVSWTFDPLRSKNAYLNFRKLGVTCNKYFVDFYGHDASSFLHRNGTDRFWVNWRLTSAGVLDRMENGVSPPGRNDRRPMLRVSETLRPVFDPHAGLSERDVSIEIPTDIDYIERHDKELAADWRESARRAFSDAIKAGHSVVDFVRYGNKGSYLLRREID